VHQTLVPFSLRSVKLLPGPLRIRFDLNRRYLMSLRNENLRQNHYQEAGLWSAREQPHDIHWGWEAWGQTVEPHGFGTHEFIHLCRLIGAQPYLC
jgi:hypothetical protein